MIVIQLNKPDFEYDTHSLVRAFCQGEEVYVIGKGEEDKENKIGTCRLLIDITYSFDQIKIEFYKEGKKISQGESSLDFYEDRKKTKNYLKRLLYQLLEEEFEKELSWGTLTGIRPVKIAVHLIQEGMKDEAVIQHLKDEYLISDEKAHLCMDIANKELNLLSSLDYEHGYSIYIGIPFCPSICLYCSFSSYPLQAYEKKVDAYVDALIHEIEIVSKQISHKKLNTIYIGGGTPSTLTPKQLEKLLEAVDRCFVKDHLKEYTVEVGRPDSIDEDKLQVLRNHHISRISINPQTMHDETLKIIGRKHNTEETIQAFQLARRVGFDNINMDIIVGLPGENKDEVKTTLGKIKELDPDSLTVHSLAIKRAARLNIFKDRYQELGIVNNKEIMDLVAGEADSMEMEPYYLYRQKNMAGNFENVGYAKVDKAGIYNILIMEEVQSILAFGAGAITKIVKDPGEKLQRIENVKDVDLYIERIDEMIERKLQGIKNLMGDVEA